jgi:hypothetical protein
MLFILLTFFAAFLIESIGTYVSVVGLSALFSSNPVVMVLAVALDIGKLVTVAFLYKHWGKMRFIMKGYMLVAAAILMLITSAGAGGYLSQQFQGAILSTKESDIRVTALKEEKTKLEARKVTIDTQIANLPANTVKGRSKLMAEFKTEIERVNNRVIEIDKELPDLMVSKAGADSHVGPILYVAKAFNISVEDAVKYVILLIIFVFDPLAVVLIIGGNFLMDARRKAKRKAERKKLEKDDEDRQHKHKVEIEELKHIHEVEEEKVEIDRIHSHLGVIKNEEKINSINGNSESSCKENIIESTTNGNSDDNPKEEKIIERDLDSWGYQSVRMPTLPETRKRTFETVAKRGEKSDHSKTSGERSDKTTQEDIEGRKRPSVVFDTKATEDNQEDEKKNLEYLRETDVAISTVQELEEPEPSVTTDEQLDQILDEIRQQNEPLPEVQSLKNVVPDQDTLPYDLDEKRSNYYESYQIK